MNPWRWYAAAGAAMILTLVEVGLAQPQLAPRAGYVYPAGAAQGSTCQVLVGGQFLESVTGALITGPGIRSKVVEHFKPITQKQFNDLREKLAELMKKPKDDATVKEIAEIRKKLMTFSRNINPAISETLTLEVTVAGDAGPGRRELKLLGPLGLSNPLAFCVGQLPEVAEPPAKPAPEVRRFLESKFGRQDRPATPEPDTVIKLPATVNGQITPGDVDRYRFQATKGQRLVVAVSARELIPYLADAVPGWFQATLALFDDKGNEIAYADDYRFHPDPVLFYVIPRDGQYVIEIRDAIYRGREDFVYRIAIGELPFVTSIFPLGGQAGTQTPLELRGWNLPITRLVHDAKGEGPGLYPICVRKGDLVSNSEPFAVDTLSECLEQEPNDQPDKAQPLALPVIVNGRIGRPGDADVSRFEGKSGDRVVAEVYARRLDSPVDSMLTLSDASGRQIAFNDDHEDKGSGLNTHHADSYLMATLPTSGTYYLRLEDVQHKGGPEYGYRLRVSPPRGDFELRVVPSSLNVRGNTTVPLTVFALRKDGCDSDITLSLKDAPPGFSLSGARVPGSQDQVRLTLTVPPVPLKEPVTLTVVGRATVNGREVVHRAVPADDMMQAFAYRHLVPAQDLKLAASGRLTPRIAVKVLTPTPLKIPSGGAARVQISLPPLVDLGNVQFELSDPPDGLTLEKVSPSKDGAEILLRSNASKIQAGLKGNLIINVFAVRKPDAAAKAPAAMRRLPLGSLPAMPFEVVGR